MKERAIPFNAAMVRATLEDRKTQTRRIVKDQTIGENYSHTLPDGRVHLEWLGEPNCGNGVWDVPKHSMQIESPYGVIGDRLWGREAWRVSKKHDATAPRDLPVRTMTVMYEAGGHAANYENGWTVFNEESIDAPWIGKYRSSMFMPRAFSRITLEVTDVRVERLQDISEADAQAEGVPRDTEPCDHIRQRCEDIGCLGQTHKASFCNLWCDLNGIPSWNANPYVWVVEFKRVGTGSSL